MLFAVRATQNAEGVARRSTHLHANVAIAKVPPTRHPAVSRKGLPEALPRIKPKRARPPGRALPQRLFELLGAEWLSHPRGKLLLADDAAQTRRHRIVPSANAGAGSAG